MESQTLDFIDKNKDRFLEELKNLLKIESISTQPAKKPEILRCAEWEAKKFKEIGLENVRLLETSYHPIVYGDWLHAAGKPTLLIYGHYDVQPPDPLEEWKTPPFEPTVKNGNIYARGATDNKGQHFALVCALEAYLKTAKRLPINVKLLIEGAEESGSEGTDEYVRENPKPLACDAVLISDMPWYDFEHPSIDYSLKGLCYFEITVKGPSHDLHSGLYGGMVRNPLQALSWILAKLKDENEHILIPRFYDGVKEMTATEKGDAAAFPFDPKALLKETGVSELVSEKGFSTVETNWARPTLDIHGLWGGYQAPGTKTIIPASAGAKVSMRLVAGQEPEKIAAQFCEYVRSLSPSGVSVEVKTYSAGPAFYVDRNHFSIRAAAASFEKAFGKKVLFTRGGASIPVAATLQQVLKAPVILCGIGLPDDRLHSPNEKISLENFYKGIHAAALLYEELGRQQTLNSKL